MGLSMTDSFLTAIDKAGLTVDRVDQYEIHEAFAATALATYQLVREQTGFDLEKHLGTRLNPNGGSLAMGHPVGATGLRLLANCQQALQENTSAKTAATTVCAGGGVSAAVVVEKC